MYTCCTDELNYQNPLAFDTIRKPKAARYTVIITSVKNRNIMGIFRYPAFT